MGRVQFEQPGQTILTVAIDEIITLEGAAGSSILKALSVTSGKLPICWSGAKLLRIRIGPPLHSANGKIRRKSKADYDQKGRMGKTGTKGSFEHASARIAKQYARREWERSTAKTKTGELIEQVEFVVDNDYVQGWMKQGISADNGLKVLFTFEA
ncbi:hypothetical protein B9479_003225 [Cryptococcus floricola]|uniref:Uncharacterized protein n=1 Tax=Cryptococcus floricola TaxID=2591691 RepID=A0A5D3AXL5_9TREE|nr:hypothetical protein B9479_003225 [Cryptococcus floricola]